MLQDFLGWTNPVSADEEQDHMNHAARACYAARALILGGHMGASPW